MERQRIVSALNLVLIGIICGAFGSFGTHTIYEIVFLVLHFVMTLYFLRDANQLWQFWRVREERKWEN